MKNNERTQTEPLWSLNRTFYLVVVRYQGNALKQLLWYAMNVWHFLKFRKLFC